MVQTLENIALFDMDGTLCDYDKGLCNELEKIRSPYEKAAIPPFRKDVPEYLQNRIDMIRKNSEWWARLSKLQLGWDVLNVARALDFRIMILTQGPRRNSSAWKGKKQWIDNNLGEDVDLTITRDKGLVYGKVLVDDFPKYIERWLKWRKNGLVIMPANNGNKGYSHEQVTRYDGSNLSDVEVAMSTAMTR